MGILFFLRTCILILPWNEILEGYWNFAYLLWNNWIFVFSCINCSFLRIYAVYSTDINHCRCRVNGMPGTVWSRVPASAKNSLCPFVYPSGWGRDSITNDRHGKELWSVGEVSANKKHQMGERGGQITDFPSLLYRKQYGCMEKVEFILRLWVKGWLMPLRGDCQEEGHSTPSQVWTEECRFRTAGASIVV